MGLTISDRNKIIYEEFIERGMNRDEALSQVPNHLRERFINDIEKSTFQSHYGSKKRFFISFIMVIIFVGFCALWMS